MDNYKAALYCRLSEEDKNKKSDSDDSESIQNQKAMLLKYAADMNWSVYDIYSDDDRTGADRERPEFKRLIDDAEQKKFDVVLCKTQSRFTREVELVEKYIHGLFPVWGIRFVSIVDNADTENKGNKKSRQINALVNEWYLEDMSENIRSVLDSKRRSGKHIGSSALYGYKKDPCKKGHLIIDDEAAAVVRKVFELFVSGMGKTRIARYLNEHGVPSPAVYKSIKNQDFDSNLKSGKLWRYPAVSSMLANEMYIGNLVQGKYGSASYKSKKNVSKPKEEWICCEGTHDAIIPRELWVKAQDMIKNRKRPYKTGVIGVFSGKVRCSGCGGVMRSVKSHNIRYLQCSRKYVSPGSCAGAFISVSALESAVFKALMEFSEAADREKIRSEQARLRKNSKSDGSAEQNAKMLKEKAAEINDVIKSLYIDKVRGVISESDFLMMYHDIKNKADRINDELAADESASGNSEQNSGCVIDDYTESGTLDRALTDIMIDRIMIEKKDAQTGEVPVTVYWNF